jgi:hypothetical protein
MEEMVAYNSTYKKLAVQWLNEALCFVSSSVVADSFVLRNPPPSPSPKTLKTNKKSINIKT